MRVGIPCSLKVDGIAYYPPAGWRLVHARQLDCGWWTVILEQEKRKPPPRSLRTILRALDVTMGIGRPRRSRRGLWGDSEYPIPDIPGDCLAVSLSRLPKL
jgi:hypothetical protein